MPLLTEVDLKMMKSPLYQCLKSDVSNKDSVRMLQITAFGLKYLSKNGVFLNKMGDPSKVPEKLENVARAKEFDDPEETSRAKDQAIEQLGGLISTLIGAYYSKPEDIISNKGKKKSKKRVENYISKAEEGYFKDHRTKFHEVATQIAKVCRETGERPAGENIFSSVKRIMDRLTDKTIHPGPNRW